MWREPGYGGNADCVVSRPAQSDGPPCATTDAGHIGGGASLFLDMASAAILPLLFHESFETYTDVELSNPNGGWAAVDLAGDGVTST